MGQVLHLGRPHFWFPGVLRSGFLSVARTRRSLRFLGRRKTMMGGDGMAFFNRSETCRMLWCFLVIPPTDGSMGLYVITRGILLDFSHCCSCRHSSLGTAMARPISALKCSSGCPLLARYTFSSPVLLWRFSSSEQILLSRRACPKGMAVLQCLGWQLFMCKY